MIARTILIVFFTFILGGVATASPESAQRRFEEANRAYAEKDYGRATTLYEAIITRDGIENPKVYLNLGNTYYRSDQLGLAVYAFRRALRLEPSASLKARLNRNLETIRAALRARTKTDNVKSQLTDDESLLYVITHFMSQELLTTSFLVFWLMFIGVLVTRRLRPKLGGLGVASVTTGLAGLILGLLLWGQVYSDDSVHKGIVVVGDAVLREGPYDKATGAPLPEGSEVKIIEGNKEWLHVKMKGDREGWVATPKVKEL